MRGIMGGVAVVVSVLLFSIISGKCALAGPLVVAGSPEYDPATDNGFKYCGVRGVNNSGIAVAATTEFVGGVNKGARPARWYASGTTAEELDILGIDSGGYSYAESNAINEAGMVVGYARKYVGGSSLGDRAVRWDGSSTAVTELGNLGTDSNGYTDARAFAINDAGMSVGYAAKYIDGTGGGQRAVRWDASGIATELGNLGISGGTTAACAFVINDAGTAAGYASKYSNGDDLGGRAVRWDISGTVTELGDLGTDSRGYTSSSVSAINASGTAVGESDKYVGGKRQGSRGVRWAASGTAVTELGNLGVDSNGKTYSQAHAINDAGTAVGYAMKYVGGSNKGSRAVRWDASYTAATELGNLGTDSSGYTNAEAFALNDVGTAVGYAHKYVNGLSTYHAVIWLPDGSAIDLNNLGVVPMSAGGTWTLSGGRELSADGYVAGEGQFDPDGDGPLAWYNRAWVTQVGLGGKWTNASGGTWGRGPNWSTGTPAMQVGDATFDLDAAYTVALDRDELTKTIALDAGTVTIDFAGHSLATESGLNIAQGATLKGAGSLLGNVFNHGILAPGTSPGTLDIDGDTLFGGSSVLDIELAGLDAYDVVNVTGNVAVEPGATLNLTMLDGFLPSPGDVFTVMTFGSIDGQFNILGLETAGPRLDAVYTSHSLELRAVPEPSVLVLLVLGGLVLAGRAFSRCRKAVS